MKNIDLNNVLRGKGRGSILGCSVVLESMAE
jgi:hypothetical protein